MGHIFISYSHRDTAYAHALAAKLQEMGFETWIDERLDYGSQWPHELQKQLDSCSAFVLILSSHSYASEWVQSELQRAKRKLKPVFPLLLEGDEPWLSVESTQYYDVRGGKFPDAKFYSALERVMGASQAEAGPVSRPADAKKAVEAKPLVRPQKSKTGVTPFQWTHGGLGTVRYEGEGLRTGWVRDSRGLSDDDADCTSLR